MEQDTQIIIKLIQDSPLDQTIKDILTRDLQAEGLTDFLREQIKAYCIDSKQQLKDEYLKAKQILEEKEQPPA